MWSSSLIYGSNYHIMIKLFNIWCFAKHWPLLSCSNSENYLSNDIHVNITILRKWWRSQSQLYLVSWIIIGINPQLWVFMHYLGFLYIIFFLFYIRFLKMKVRQFWWKTKAKTVQQMMNGFTNAMQMFAKGALCKVASTHLVFNTPSTWQDSKISHSSVQG